MPISHKVAARSDTGRVRTNNEDRHAYFVARQGFFWMVCDGMGGHAAGEIAAQLAIESIVNFLENCKEEIPPHALLEQSLVEANAIIYKMAQSIPQYQRMGTTCVLAYMPHGTEAVYYAHIGDSRLYWRGGEGFRQMTVDHTYVQFLLLIGAITPEEAAFHPRRHVILRALGISPKPEVEVAPQPIPVRAGDMILLCTDGLTNMLSDLEIERIITSGEPLQRRADRLIQAANEAGGEDNITVLLVEFE